MKNSKKQRTLNSQMSPVAPRAYRSIPVVTGDPDTDAKLEQTAQKSRALRLKIQQHIGYYGPKTVKYGLMGSNSDD